MLDALIDKTLVMLIGPTAIGKSTLMNSVVKLDNEFARATGFTTRQPRNNDEPGQYRYYTKADVERKQGRGELVQSATFPTTGDIYGTEAADYSGHYNLKDVLVNAVDNFKTLPFERIVTISLTTDPESWQAWFKARYPVYSETARKRLQEAALSIEWSLNQSDGDHHWVVNKKGNADQSAHEVIGIARGTIQRTDRPYEAARLLKIVQGLLS